MKTVRKSTFETNSSSCHVLTVADQNDYDMIKEGKALIYVPRYSSDCDSVYDSEILTKEKYLEYSKAKFNERFDEFKGYFDEAWDIFFTDCDYEEELDRLSVDYKIPRDIESYVEEFIWHCHHEEEAIDILDGAAKKNANGATIYISCWDKCC